ncbi:MAG: cytochrome c oxidase subunit 3 family protein [Thermoanaerobaculia bacterium]
MAETTHPPRKGALAHHFDSYDQQREASSLGMWLFLSTELMFFGGLFLAYVIYRGRWPQDFALASHELDVILGGVNTVVLIASSLTMALAVRAAQLARSKATVVFLLLTLLFGLTFLGIKAVEYADKLEHHLVPGAAFEFHGAADPGHAEMFFNLYFGMTGLHAAHMVVGAGLVAWLMWPAWRGRFDTEYHNPVEVVGLYWHFVDIIWIFLFPLLYLIGFHVEG